MYSSQAFVDGGGEPTFTTSNMWVEAILPGRVGRRGMTPTLPAACPSPRQPIQRLPFRRLAALPPDSFGLVLQLL